MGLFSPPQAPPVPPPPPLPPAANPPTMASSSVAATSAAAKARKGGAAGAGFAGTDLTSGGPVLGALGTSGVDTLFGAGASATAAKQTLG